MPPLTPLDKPSTPILNFDPLEENEVPPSSPSNFDSVRQEKGSPPSFPEFDDLDLVPVNTQTSQSTDQGPMAPPIPAPAEPLPPYGTEAESLLNWLSSTIETGSQEAAADPFDGMSDHENLAGLQGQPSSSEPGQAIHDFYSTKESSHGNDRRGVDLASVENTRRIYAALLGVGDDWQQSQIDALQEKSQAPNVLRERYLAELERAYQDACQLCERFASTAAFRKPDDSECPRGPFSRLFQEWQKAGGCQEGLANLKPRIDSHLERLKDPNASWWGMKSVRRAMPDDRTLESNADAVGGLAQQPRPHSNVVIVGPPRNFETEAGIDWTPTPRARQRRTPASNADAVRWLAQQRGPHPNVVIVGPPRNFETEAGIDRTPTARARQRRREEVVLVDDASATKKTKCDVVDLTTPEGPDVVMVGSPGNQPPARGLVGSTVPESLVNNYLGPVQQFALSLRLSRSAIDPILEWLPVTKTPTEAKEAVLHWADTTIATETLTGMVSESEASMALTALKSAVEEITRRRSE